MANIVNQKASGLPEILPDNKSHTNRFEIASESSDKIYIVAQAKSSGQWQCSCPGWIYHRKCKHLRSLEPVFAKLEAKAS